MQSRRIDLEREISIRVPAFDAFITEYSSNVSTTGMFIKSDKPQPPDTKLTFEFRVADEWKLIRGKAKVVWSRYSDEGLDRPAGMGVLFTELDAQSRRLIQWIIEKHVRDGGTPFDLGELKESYETETAGGTKLKSEESAPPATTQVVPQQRPIAERPPAVRPSPAEQARRAQAKPEAPIFRMLPLLAAGIVVAGVLGLLFWLSERGAQSAANPDLDPPTVAEASAPVEGSEAQEGVGEEAPALTSEPTDEAESASVTSEPEATTGESPRPAGPVFAEAAERLVSSWSSAWSSQDVDGYLSHYARSFEPSNGQSRGAWERNRQQRLTAPEFINITISGLETEVLGDARGRAVFTQGYKSNTYEDSVRKALVLIREDGRWKILEETSVQ